MKNMVGIFFWVLFAIVIQTTLAPNFVLFLSRGMGFNRLAGQTFDLALVTLVYLAIRRDLGGTFLWTAVLGIVIGAFGLGWKGAQATSYFAVALLAQISKRGLMVGGLGGFASLVAVLTLVEGVVHLELGALFSQIPSPLDGQFWPLTVQTILNTLISPVVFGALSLFDEWTMEKTSRSHYGLTTL